MKPQVATSVLKSAPIFRTMPDELVEELAQSAASVVFDAGDPIFAFGDGGDSMFVITSGSVRISLPSESGRDIILADLGPGDSFGEIALLDGGGRSASASALARTSAIRVTRRDLLNVLGKSQPALLALIELLCRRIRDSDERMAEVAFLSLQTRLARALTRHAASSGHAGSLLVRLSQNELAQMILASREAVNRQLGRWQRQRLLEVTPAGIEIRRHDALVRLGYGVSHLE